MNQPPPSATAAILKPSVQHAQFGVDPDAARRMQIEARLEKFRRQSPTPKNLLSRLSAGQFARPSDLPKTYQTLDPVQSASEQLNTSTPVASPQTNTLKDPKYSVRRPAQIKTPTLKTPTLESSGIDHRQRPPLSASKGISLESVILQKQRDREQILAATKVATMVLQESRSNSPFSSKPTSRSNSPSLSFYPANISNNALKLLPAGNISKNTSPLLNSSDKTSPLPKCFTPMRSDWRHSKTISNNRLDPASSFDEQPIALRSPLSAPRGSSPKLGRLSSQAVVSSPVISTSLNEPQLLSPIPQGSPLLDIPSDPEFVPERFAETLESTPTQHLLPTGRTSRVVQALHPLVDSASNSSLQALMDIIGSKSGTVQTPTRLIADNALSVIENDDSKSKNKIVSGPEHSDLTTIATKPDSSKVDNLLCFRNMEVPKTLQDTVCDENAAHSSPKNASQKSDFSEQLRGPPVIELPGPDFVNDALEADEICVSNASDTVHISNNALTVMQEASSTGCGSDVGLPKFQSAEFGSSRPVNLEGDQMVVDHDVSPANQHSGLSVNTASAGIELYRATNIVSDDVGRRIITPKRSISLRKSTSPVRSSRKQKPRNEDVSNHQEVDSNKRTRDRRSSSTKGSQSLRPRESRFNSPDDSVRSVDGSSSNRSVSECQRGSSAKTDEVDDYICLDNWYIDHQGKSVSIFGADAKNQQKAGGRIVCRNDQSSIVIAGGKKVLLGKMDIFAMKASFGDQAIQSFAGGFPEKWLDLINPDNLQSPHTSSKDDTSLIKQNSASNTQAKRVVRSEARVRRISGDSSMKTLRKKCDVNRGSAVTPVGTEPVETSDNRKSRSARAIRTSSDTTAKSDRSTVATSTITADAKKHTPTARARPKKEPSTVPRDHSGSLLQDCNMLLELPLDAVEGVTFSHSGRRRVQPLKFWLTERIIAETGTICTVSGKNSPTAKRPRKRTTAPKSKPRSSPAKRARKQSRRKSQ